MGASIVDIKNLGDALRSSGYKDIESAVSEIIDNSVEAEAKDIFVILKDSVNPTSGKKNITEIGFLDNGIGMNAEILGKCLGLGVSTRQARKGMGRFGVGLPQASLYACPEVYVYSWQNGIENAKFVYLNINQVKNGEQTEIPDPKPCELPENYRSYINLKDLYTEYDFSKNGTLVIWKNCDRVNPKTISALKSRLEFSIGQKFRYFIHDKKCSIKIINDSNKDDITTVFPNDPLFLMEDNYALGNPNKPKELFERGKGENLEPIFEPYTDGINKTGEKVIPVKYYDKNGFVKTSNVIIRYSIVKKKFYGKEAYENNHEPGNSHVGQHAKKLEGVSIVRAGREIDFGQFGFYENLTTPNHRWWGCEILFNPELDEVFGVSNNKQQVKLRKEDDDIGNDEIQAIWDLLYTPVHDTIKEMFDRNTALRAGSRSNKETRLPLTSQIAGTVDKVDEDEDCETSTIKKDVSTEELEKRGKDALCEDEGILEPTKEQIRQFLNSSVYFIYKNKSKNDAAFDCSFDCGNRKITINTSHKFYSEFLEKIYDDENAKTTFELFLAAFYWAVDRTKSRQSDENDRLISTWLKRLDDYIDEQLNPSKE